MVFKIRTILAKASPMVYPAGDLKLRIRYIIKKGRRTDYFDTYPYQDGIIALGKKLKLKHVCDKPDHL